MKYITTINITRENVCKSAEIIINTKEKKKNHRTSVLLLTRLISNLEKQEKKT
jgi:hypothetical protein